jgi:hypothetical protein
VACKLLLEVQKNTDNDSVTTDSPSKKKHFGKKLLYILLPYFLIGIGLTIPSLGGVIFLGPLLVAFAPDFLLVGIALIIVRVLVSQKKPGKRIAVFILVCVALGLNTRIPSIVHDLLISRDRANLTSKLSLSVGDSIHLDSKVTELAARRFPYSGSRPQCNEGFCAVIIGYYPPATFLGIDYWKENPAQSVKSFGFSLANVDDVAPTLKVRANEEGYVLNISLELLDVTGKLVSSENRIYRNGFPLESRDLDGKGSRGETFLWAVEYLVHGNMVSSFVSRKFGYSQASPTGYFLNSSIERYVQQDDPKLTQQLDPIVDNVKVFNSEVSDDVWNAIFFDLERSNACKTFVQHDIDNIDIPDFTVEGGIRGMGKARSPLKFLRGKNGNERLLVRMGSVSLCDGDYLYLIEHPNPYANLGQYEISKYRYDGTFVYRAAFKMPQSPAGFIGGISPTSLKEADGVIKFDYVDFVNSGQNRSINRIRSMHLIHQKTGKP